MDNRSLFSHHSSELGLLKDRALDRSQKRVQDWVNSFPPGNSLTAANEFNFSQPDSATADHPVQDNAHSKPPENSFYNAGNSNHLEMLSQYRRPGVAVSIAPLSKRHCIGNTSKIKCQSVSDKGSADTKTLRQWCGEQSEPSFSRRTKYCTAPTPAT